MVTLLCETDGEDVGGNNVADRLLDVLPCVPDEDHTEYILKNLAEGRVLYVNDKTKTIKFSTFKPTGDIQL